MVVGFNHNFRYLGEVYHIQTEDSGVKSPNIVTLLYQGGTILASKKTSYADIAKVDNLEQVVEELMKEQHKGMLRSLKSGDFDDIIERFKAGKQITPKISEGVTAHVSAAEAASAEEPPADDESVAVVKPAPEPIAAPGPIPKKPMSKPGPGTPQKEPAPVAEVKPSAAVEVGLDEVILSYLMGED